jgi:hypothetical protein
MCPIMNRYIDMSILGYKYDCNQYIVSLLIENEQDSCNSLQIK